MRVYIIEPNEIDGQKLEYLLRKLVPDMEIAGRASSVREYREWLSAPGDGADVIFIATSLPDGSGFDLIKNAEIDSDFIMTSADDRHAVESFEVGSVDYLVKPVRPEDLKRAILKCCKKDELDNVAKGMVQISPERGKMLIRLNAQIFSIEYQDIAYIYAQDKSNFLVTKDGRCYIIDRTMGELEKILNQNDFFRVSRMCIISRDAIKDYFKMNDTKYAVLVSPRPSFSIEVSLSRSDNFIKWLKGV